MAEPGSQRPTICLNMIVRNEAHVVHEVLDSVAPFIDHWVVVDTGSTDGTQDQIREHMERRRVPGELIERPWRDFGHNRSEAITLARGRADYIWVMDADDLLVGAPDFSRLSADVYQLQYGPDVTYWRRQLFRDGLPWRYVGVLHEYADCEGPFTEDKLQGEYYIESRRLGNRNLDPNKYLRDAEVLLAEVERHPEDSRSVFYLAQSYYDARDFAQARAWYTRRSQMGDFEEEVFYSLLRIGDSMANLEMAWPEVQQAYLQAWEFRPSRAEPLYAIARTYRVEGRHQLGHLFAERAASVAFPDQDVLFVAAEVYTWRAMDEQAVCGSWIGRHEETVQLCETILRRNDVPDDDRQRIVGNRDCSAPLMLAAMAAYPESIVRGLGTGPRNGDVTVTVVAGADRAATERTLNSFVRCCTDIDEVGSVLIIDIGLTAEDRSALQALYPFVGFRRLPPGARPGQIRDEITSRFWLHLGMGWQFFVADSYLRRLLAVLEAEPDVSQVGLNYRNADTLTGTIAPLSTVRSDACGARYVIADAPAAGPAIFDCARTQSQFTTATLDEVLCVLRV